MQKDLAINPQDTSPLGNIEQNIIVSKGELIAGGSTGLTELMPSGHVAKSPWTGREAALCRRELTLESQIYEILGPHPRLVKIIAWDPTECVLVMEFMPNGCLKDYLLAHNDISTTQRLRWAQEAAEGLQLLHSKEVVHCDLGPKNFLLDADLSLKIADFSGSSLKGSRTQACASSRFLTPAFDYRVPQTPPTVQYDLYALGSTIYNIMTNKAPYKEMESKEVRKLYESREFPDVSGTLCGEIIQRCWHCEFESAQEVYDLIRGVEVEQSCKFGFLKLWNVFECHSLLGFRASL